MSDAEPLDCHVFVCCQNEANRIGACLVHLKRALGDWNALITLNINGSSDNSLAIAQETARREDIPLEVFVTAAGDKANAINQFLYVQRRNARMYVFVDGYALVSRGALAGLMASLTEHPFSMAATGITTTGRTIHLMTERTLTKGGILHGGLHALRPDFVDRMVMQGIRLPIGTYRVDGLMGSMAAHNLDAIGEAWDDRRIRGVKDAQYELPSLSLFRVRDLLRQFRRRIRQMRGTLENLAIKDIIYQHGYTGLPDNADDMIKHYIEAHGVPDVALIDRFFLGRALNQIRHRGPRAAENYTPQRVFEAG